DGDGGTKPTVTGVTVTAAAETVAKGGSLQFTAAVAGTGNPVQSVTWSIATTGIASGTAINTEGLLTVAADESKTSIEVKAASTLDSGKSGTKSVSVTGTGGEETPTGGEETPTGGEETPRYRLVSMGYNYSSTEYYLMAYSQWTDDEHYTQNTTTSSSTYLSESTAVRDGNTTTTTSETTIYNGSAEVQSRLTSNSTAIQSGSTTTTTTETITYDASNVEQSRTAYTQTVTYYAPIFPQVYILESTRYVNGSTDTTTTYTITTLPAEGAFACYKSTATDGSYTIYKVPATGNANTYSYNASDELITSTVYQNEAPRELVPGFVFNGWTSTTVASGSTTTNVYSAINVQQTATGFECDVENGSITYHYVYERIN
ncbi:MAG: hypothetical protein LBG72_03415, partial [Spirochaetaceae bacterium]|nr:hypothetical protein [Spirochaetaceae bacterium]